MDYGLRKVTLCNLRVAHCYIDHKVLRCKHMERQPSRDQDEEPVVLKTAETSPSAEIVVPSEQTLTARLGHAAVATERAEEDLTASTRPRFQVLREAPIAAPVDRAEYRKYRIRHALSLLPKNASEELREWVTEVENKLMDNEQTLAFRPKATR